MPDKLDWKFPGTKDGEIKGLNDSGVETFRGNVLFSLAREICQNSLDARHPPHENGGPPVIVEFKLFSTPLHAFPALGQFQDALASMEAFWRKKENEQSLDFLGKLNRTLKKNNLTWLRISDFQTSGLKGVSNADPDASTYWNNLVKSSGVSQKVSSGGGSFGIGKFAPFSCSALRTIFYATQSVDGEKGFQGVARLMSFRDTEGLLASGIGYCGCNGAKPLDDWMSLDPDFTRNCPGTDIFIPGFLGKDIHGEIIKSVLDGFLYAIYHNRLVVKVDDGKDQTIIDSKWLADERQEGKICGDDQLTFKYDALQIPSDQWLKKSIGGGSVRLGIAVGPGRQSKIAMIRDDPGMQIFQKGFTAALSFTGVLIVEGGLNSELKTMENPQHTGWQINRNPEKGDLLRELYAFCEECIREKLKALPGEEIDSGLGDILPDEGDDEKREQETLAVKLVRGEVKKEKPKGHRKRPHPAKGGDGEGDSGGRSGESGEHTGGGKSGGRARGNQGGGAGEKQTIRYEVPHESFRSICADRARGAYRLKLTPGKNAANGSIDISTVAEIKDYPATVLSASLADGTPLRVDGSTVSGLTFEKGVRLDINVILDSTDFVSLEVDCHGHK